MRELETIQQAVRAAETGQLVLATLHTKDALGAIDWLIDVFPPGQQEQIRLQLSEVLLAVYAQQLVPAAPEERVLHGRVAAVEVLLGPMAELYATGAQIRDKRTQQLVTLMDSNVRLGCQTMEGALVDLVLAGKVTEQAALDAAVRKEAFQRLLATQIVIQTEILDPSMTATSQLGIQWTWQPFSITQGSPWADCCRLSPRSTRW